MERRTRSQDKPGVKACLACRKVKMRCHIGDLETICERCARKSMECIFQDHRRGRKRGARISKTGMLVDPSSVPVTGSSAAEGTPRGKTPPAGDDSRDLQPPGLLHQSATQGRFSLHTVLNPAVHEPSTRPRETSKTVADPVQLGLVNITIAESLFHHFINVLNPYISQLDPLLHTMDYVRERSEFLFTAMLAVAAKTFNSAIYRVLYDHAETLMAAAFRRGEKSVEIAQAMMVMTYWKEPDDTRVWVSLGYVIRMGMDLGWHLLKPGSDGADNIKAREQRNVQRTWYVLYVYDQSMSLQTGKPWMIERNDFVQSIEAWCQQPLSSANDRLLGAFVTLRILGAEVFQLLRGSSSRLRTEADSLHHVESLLGVLETQLDTWERLWLPRVEADARHQFMVRFYGTHLRLQLFSLPLPRVLASSDRDLPSHLRILWTSYTSALAMLELICQSTEWLFFAQDSIHIMTAYSAAFLVKLLLSAPSSITTQIEAKVIETIQATALVFSRQSAPPTSSCALQARFLDRILSNITKTNRHIPPDSRPDVASRDAFSGDLYATVDSAGMEPLDWLLEENEARNNLFALAGFDIEEGIFFT